MAYSKNRRLAEIVSDTSGNISVEGIVVPTQSSSDNDTSAASTAFVHAHIDAVLDSAPGTLNTLNEIAAALNDDANFNTTITNAIAAKLPLAGGTLTGNLGIGVSASSAIGVYHSQSLANGLAAELTNTQSSTGSGIVVKGGNNSSTYSADFRDYNNTTLMRIRGDGNVGIGTTNPRYLLETRADIDSFVMKIENDGNSAGTNGASYADASDGLWVDTRWNTATNTPFKVTSNSGTAPMMIIKGNGNVGIGTTSPSSNLEVRGSASNGQIYLGGSTSATYGKMYSDNDGTLILAADAGNNATSSSFRVEVDGTERMRITDDGDVSIGSDHAGFSGWRVLNLRGEAGSGALLNWESNNATRKAAIAQSGSDLRLQVFDTGSITFEPGTGTEKMRITSSGKVGIGTATPQNNHAKANNLVVGSGSAGGMAVYNGTAEGWYAFSRSNANNSDAYDGGISYNGDRDLKFHTNAGGARMTIDGQGKVGIGTTIASNKFGVKVTSINTNERLINLYTGTTGPGKYVSIGAQYSETNLLSNSEIRFGNEVQSNAPSFLAFATGNTTTPPERMRIDSNGVMFLGDTGPQMHSAYRGIVFENGSLITDITRSAGKSITLAQNASVDTGNTWAYLATDEASYYQQYNGKHYFATAPSGNAGTDVTFNNKMIIDNDYVVPKMNFHYAENNIYAVNTTGDEHSLSSGIMILKQQISVRAGSKILVWYDSGQILNNNQGGNGSVNSNPQIAVYVSTNSSAPTSRGGANQINGNTDHTFYPAGNIGSARIKMNGMGATGSLSAGTYYIYLYGGSYNSGQYTFNYQNSSGNNRGSSIMWAEIMA